MRRSLTNKQYSFCSNYIKNGFNAAQAARDAGYSASYASSRAYKLIKSSPIQERITSALTQIESNLEDSLAITIEDKLRLLSTIIRDIMDEPDDAKRRCNYDAVLKAIDILNKIQGHYAANKQFNFKVDTTDQTKERLAEVKRIYDEY